MIELLPELVAERAAIRKFVDQELEPFAKIIDETGEVPEKVLTLLRKNGYLGMQIDEKYGGGGLGLGHYCLVHEEFSRSHRVFGILVNATSGMGPTVVQNHGTPAQRDKYLRILADGTYKMTFALTEPGSGTDAGAMITKAVKKNGGWVINGRKHWISGADVADAVMVMAVTDQEKRSRGGVTSFIVEKGTPGFSVTRVDTTMGSEAIKLAELTFEDCYVPDTQVLGEVGGGFKLAMGTLTEGRLTVACSCIGITDKLLEMSIQHAKTRVTFGKPLAERQAIQWMLADTQVELTAARAMTYEIIRQYVAGKNIGGAVSECKLFCAEMVGRVADRAVQIHGGMGIVKGFKVERFYRDVRHYRVGEGTSEIQRIIIARDLLKNR